MKTLAEDANIDNIEENDEIYDVLHDVYAPQIHAQQFNLGSDTFQPNIEDGEIDGLATLLKEAKKMLFPGARLSSLNFIVKLLHIKVLNKWSNKSLDMILNLLKDTLPERTYLPSSTYEAKKMLKDFGLGYEVIHACKYDICTICGESRYKSVVGKGKKFLKKYYDIFL